VFTRILNSQVIQFIPIINYNSSDPNKSLSKDVSFKDAGEEGEEDKATFETLQEYVNTKFYNSEISEIFKSNTDTLNINWFREGEEGSLNNNDYIIDGENVII